VTYYFQGSAYNFEFHRTSAYFNDHMFVHCTWKCSFWN